MRTKLGCLTAFYAALAGFQTGPTADDLIFQIRLVYEAPAPDREAREHEGETIHLGLVVLSDADLIEVHPSTRDGQLRLTIGMTEEAAERMFETTSGHVGRRIAILLEGRLRSVVNVGGPVGKGPDTVLGTDPARGWRADVDLGPAGAEAPGLVQRIRARWPAPDPSPVASVHIRRGARPSANNVTGTHRAGRRDHPLVPATSRNSTGFEERIEGSHHIFPLEGVGRRASRSRRGGV